MKSPLVLRSPGAASHNGAYVASRVAIGEKTKADVTFEAQLQKVLPIDRLPKCLGEPSPRALCFRLHGVQRRILRRVSLEDPSHAAAHLLGVRVHARAAYAPERAAVAVFPLVGDPRILAGAHVRQGLARARAEWLFTFGRIARTAFGDRGFAAPISKELFPKTDFQSR